MSAWSSRPYKKKFFQGTEWLFLDDKKYTPLSLNMNARVKNGIFSAVEAIWCLIFRQVFFLQPLIVDVRTEDEFAAGRIPGAVNIPLSEVLLIFVMQDDDF